MDFAAFAVDRAPALYRSALLLCSDPHAAEDLVQEALAKVYVAWRRIENPAAYAHTTLVRVFVSSRRKLSSTERPVASLPESTAHPDDPGLRIDLNRALDTLSRIDRAVLVMRFLEDQTVEQTGEALRLSPGAVRVRTHRALAKVRPLLDIAEESLS